MDKELKDKLEANGFDVDVTLQRFMNNEKLYFKFLKKLPADQNYVSFGEAINNGDWFLRPWLNSKMNMKKRL